jgi:hypothetical protein
LRLEDGAAGLLQEDQDALAAEQAWRDILEFDPGNQEARQNLAVLEANRPSGTRSQGVLV